MIARATISNPASMLITLFKFAPNISRHDREMVTSVEVLDNVFGEWIGNASPPLARSPHDFRNLPKSLVGGWRSVISLSKVQKKYVENLTF